MTRGESFWSGANDVSSGSRTSSYGIGAHRDTPLQTVIAARLLRCRKNRKRGQGAASQGTGREAPIHPPFAVPRRASPVGVSEGAGAKPAPSSSPYGQWTSRLRPPRRQVPPRPHPARPSLPRRRRPPERPPRPWAVPHPERADPDRAPPRRPPPGSARTGRRRWVPRRQRCPRWRRCSRRRCSRRRCSRRRRSRRRRPRRRCSKRRCPGHVAPGDVAPGHVAPADTASNTRWPAVLVATNVFSACSGSRAGADRRTAHRVDLADAAGVRRAVSAPAGSSP